MELILDPAIEFAAIPYINIYKKLLTAVLPKWFSYVVCLTKIS
jgi:hypothetical protein